MSGKNGKGKGNGSDLVGPVVRSKDEERSGLMQKVRMFYDLQRLRIQVMGRVQNRAEGTEIHLHPADVALLEMRANVLHTSEKEVLKDVQDHLRTIGFYKDVLSDKTRFKGVGPTMAGVILSEFDITKEDTPSKMWAFAGLAPVPAKRCKECHAVVDRDEEGVYFHRKERPRKAPGKKADDEKKAPAKKWKTCSLLKQPLNEDQVYASGEAMRPKKGEKLPYNSWLRTKLVGVLAPVLLKVGSPWKKLYDDYKNRKASAGWGRSDAHRHQAAMRYMIKMLLLEIWREWRNYEGLPIRSSYQEQYLGHTHGSSASQASSEQEDPEVLAEMANLG